MIGLVVATHGNLGAELLASAQMIIGPVLNARSVSINQENSMEDIRDAVLKDWKSAKANENREQDYAKRLNRYIVEVRRSETEETENR